MRQQLQLGRASWSAVVTVNQCTGRRFDSLKTASRMNSAVVLILDWTDSCHGQIVSAMKMILSFKSNTMKHVVLFRKEVHIIQSND